MSQKDLTKIIPYGDLAIIPLESSRPIGEKVDAHKFLEQVAEKGAGAVLTSEHKEKTEERRKSDGTCTRKTQAG